MEYNFFNAYQNWLLEEMDGYSHRILFDVLYDTQYTWILPRDADRAYDGMYLRVRFEQESGLEVPDGWDEWPCSLLEMIIAMAYSIREKIMYDPENEIEAAEWFWLMMDNVGLSIFDDATMLEQKNDAFNKVSDICDRVMSRRYTRLGHGGFFPLEHSDLDQRGVEYWYQMNQYFMEKGYI